MRSRHGLKTRDTSEAALVPWLIQHILLRMHASCPEPVAESHVLRPVRGLRRAVYVVLGIILVGLALLGAFLPLLPTTPFLLLASFFFIRSSPRLNAWLLRSPLFGPFLQDWHRHRGVRLRVKITAVAVIIVAIGASLIFGGLSPWLSALLVVLGLIGLIVVLRLRLIRDNPEQSPASPQLSHLPPGEGRREGA